MKSLAAIRRALSSVFHSAVILTGLLIFSAAAARAQSPTDGSTPLALSPGAPAGSYGLSDFEHVNLYNGNLGVVFRLLSVGGRGEFGYPITLRPERHWQAQRSVDSTGSDVYRPTASWWGNGDSTFNVSAGVMRARKSGTTLAVAQCPTPGSIEHYGKTLTRLTFTAPDGTEYELRDTVSDGAPATVPLCPTLTGFSRGSTFVTADGSSATFVSDAAITDANYVGVESVFKVSGYLLLRDGTRYRIDNSSVTWVRDRNGNQLNFSYNATTGQTIITDSLNRQVTVQTNYTDVAPYGLCHKITFKGFGGATRIVRVSLGSLSTALRTTRTGDLGAVQTYKALFPELSGSSTTTYNPTVATSVWLPDDDGVTRRYQLFYNVYGELARVVLPTGGAYEYDYAVGYTDGAADGVIDGNSMAYIQIYRRVVERRVYLDGTTLEGKTTYSRPESSTSDLGYVVVDQYDAAGALKGRQRHYYYGAASLSFNLDQVSYPGWQQGREYRAESFAADGTTVLQRVDHTWQQPVSGSSWPLGQAETNLAAKSNNPQITQAVTTLVDTNKVSKQTFKYDQYNNRTDVYEYDYGSGAAGSLVRRTTTTYLTTNVVAGTTYDYGADTTIHLRNLPAQISVYNASGAEQARTAFEYDNYTATAPRAALTARTNISGLDSAYTTSKKTRGNVTAVTRYLLSGGTVSGSVSAYQQYDVAGNVVKAIDAENNATTYTFADRFGTPDTEAQSNSAPVELGTQQSYAYAGLVTNAMGHKFYTQRDYYTGKVVNAEDPNSTVSSASYDDPLDRPTQVVSAADDATQALTAQKTFSYDDANRVVTTTGDLSALDDNHLKSQVLYDGLGRTVEARQYETATTYVMTKTTYDALGRVSRVSNPYRTGTPSWTETTYDALGRVVSVKTLGDNAAALTSYSGNTVTVTDQGGHDRQSTTDALGRLTQVVEDPGGLGYVTTYTYDLLDNLKTVTQTGLQNGASVTETRTFTYDSLSRLLSVTNPESGTISYEYDNNGNLTKKVDPRLLPGSTTTKIETTYAYDAINRVATKSYNDSTPDVTCYYDAQTLPTGAPSFSRGASVGRLVAVLTTGTTAGTYYGYDGLGQVLRRTQRTDSVTYIAEATYNKAGGMLTETRPAVPNATDRRTVSYTYDGAGRLLSLNSNATTYAAGAGVSNITYAPHGALDKETLGNNLVHDINYNARLQPTQIRLGTTAAPTSVLDLTYNYGTTTNNGNLLDATEKIGTWTRKQVYTYDALNRLDKTEENNGSTSTPLWSEDNAYDRFGNRWEVISGTTPLTFNSKNQIAGYVYDAAGNLTDDTAHTYAYDAENRLKAVGTVTSAFTYDGEGKRVKKDFPLEEQVRFVYGVGGQLVMEINTASNTLKKEYMYGADGLLATIEPVVGVSYMTPDHLGTPRVVTGATGNPVSRHDYKTFGRELVVGDGGRTSAQFFDAGDDLRKKFAGYERDAETGLDYAQARYYASGQGRFTSPDPLLASARVSDPQSWNRYSYCVNSPVNLVDPLGMESSRPSDEEKEKDDKDDKASKLEKAVADLIGFNPWKRYRLHEILTPDAISGWQVVVENGEKKYVWNNDPNVNDVPLNFRYIDVFGRAIQLWGTNNAPPGAKTHGWQIVEAGPEAEKYTEQEGAEPPSYSQYEDTASALGCTGYVRFFGDQHPSHWGGNDFAQTTSPTLHVTLFTKDRSWFHPFTRGHGPLTGVTFHYDRHTQAGSLSDWFAHLKDFFSGQ